MQVALSRDHGASSEPELGDRGSVSSMLSSFHLLPKTGYGVDSVGKDPEEDSGAQLRKNQGY